MSRRTVISETPSAAAASLRWMTRCTKQWRDDQIYQVDVNVLRTGYHAAHFPASYAARKAEVLASTVRTATAPMAEAAIAWSDARHRATIHKIVRTIITIILAIGFFLSLIPATPDY